jgi:20S proteasome subunit beta 2
VNTGKAIKSFPLVDETQLFPLLETNLSPYNREIQCPGSFLAIDSVDLTTTDAADYYEDEFLSRERFLLTNHPPQTHKLATDNKNTNLKFTKTGTTIVGVAIDGVCVLAADTRATAGSLVADNRAEKLHLLNARTVAAGAGTSADLQHITRECAAVAALQARWNQVGNDVDSEREDTASIVELVYWLRKRLYERNGACQANLIVGGIHHNGKAQLRAIHPHGSVDVVPFTALGSGGMAAMSVLEQGYHALAQADDPRQAAQDLCIQAIRAGIENDLGSGSQVDICVVDAKSGCVMTRGVYAEERLPSMDERLENTGDTGGVNGFGKVPFVLQSPRVVQPSDVELQKRERERWSSIINDVE